MRPRRPRFAASSRRCTGSSSRCKGVSSTFATDLLEDGYDIRTMQVLLGHRGVRPTMIYTPVPNRGARAASSPFDEPL